LPRARAELSLVGIEEVEDIEGAETYVVAQAFLGILKINARLGFDFVQSVAYGLRMNMEFLRDAVWAWLE
jgi:hypothetical protein